MALYKQVWQYADTNGATFSETHFIEAGNANAAAEMNIEFVNLRLSFLHNLFTLQRIRSTNVESNRDTGNRQYGLPGTNTPSTAGTITAYAASTSAVFTLSGASGGSRRWWIRGLNEAQIFRNAVTGKTEMSNTFQDSVKAFIAAAATKNMGIRRLAPTAQTALNFVPIDGISLALDGQSTLLLLRTPIAAIPGSYIIVYGVNQKNYNGLNGKFKVISNNPPVININYVPPPLPLAPKIKGTVRLATYSPLSVYSPTGVALHHLGEHDTKSPLFGSRGAKRAPRRRTQA